MFRESMRGRGNVGSAKIDQLSAADPGAPEKAIESIFDHISNDRMKAAEEVLGYLDAGNSASDIIDGARRLIFLKGHDSHDYKFSSAALEDYYHISPAWRNRYLAASVFNLKGTADRDNQLTERTRSAFQKSSA